MDSGLVVMSRARERKQASDRADAFFKRHYAGEARPWTRPPPPAH
jgi:hypothetical protein